MTTERFTETQRELMLRANDQGFLPTLPVRTRHALLDRELIRRVLPHYPVRYRLSPHAEALVRKWRAAERVGKE